MAADDALATPADESARVLAQPSPFAAFWSAFRENRGAVFGLSVVVTVRPPPPPMVTATEAASSRSS